MGMLRSVGAVRMRADTSVSSQYEAMWRAPEGWLMPLEMAGLSVTPELALMLATVHCIVSTISDDFGTMTCQTFEDFGDDGMRRVRYADGPIGSLAYRLQWQPNSFQTAKAFWSTLAWQFLLRPIACAEILRRPGSDIITGVVPRHPDRVREERLAGGGLRYILTEANGTPRPVLPDDMLIVRNTSSDGLNAVSRTRFGAKAISSGLALQDFTRNYFKKGATAALLATYKGDKDGPDEDKLHASISRYMSGVENAGGLLLVGEEVDIKGLGVDPHNAELLGLKNLSRRELCALWKFPPHKAAIEGAQGYGAQVQSAQEYVTGCQMPMVVEFEQAIKMKLLTDYRYASKFNMDYLLRADLKTRMESYEIGIRARVFRPSEARVREGLPPDPALDALSEKDYRPGSSGSVNNGSGGNSQARQIGSGRTVRADLRAMLMVHDAAVRCVHRERAAVEKLAKKYPGVKDVQTWRDELKSYYEDHSRFVADTMRMSIETARAYSAQHGAIISDNGIVAMSDHWARQEAEELAGLSLEPIVEMAA